MTVGRGEQADRRTDERTNGLAAVAVSVTRADLHLRIRQHNVRTFSYIAFNVHPYDEFFVKTFDS